MRLIDADKLETTAVLGVQLQHADSRYYYFYEEETIEKAPTVQAIPIELYEQVKGERDAAVEQLKSLNIELFEKPYRKAISIEWIVKEWAKKFWKVINDKKYYTGEGYDTVWDMIEDWEKENGE